MFNDTLKSFPLPFSCFYSVTHCFPIFCFNREPANISTDRDDPSVEKSTRLLEVSGRERKVKTSMNTGGGAAQQCCMLSSQRVARGGARAPPVFFPKK